jgi:hypothetical protein
MEAVKIDVKIKGEKFYVLYNKSAELEDATKHFVETVSQHAIVPCFRAESKLPTLINTAMIDVIDITSVQKVNVEGIEEAVADMVGEAADGVTK